MTKPGRARAPTLSEAQYELLRDIVSQPTAPFQESYVVRCVTGHLARCGVPYFLDPVGNVVVGVGSLKAYQAALRARAAEPLRVFIAHMDHPGFHGLRWLAPRRLAVQWHGGSPVAHVNGASVWLADAAGVIGTGCLRAVRLSSSRMAMQSAVVQLDRTAAVHKECRPTDVFGGLQFSAPFRKEGRLVHARAIDDLANVFVIVELACQAFAKGKLAQAPFIGLLTRGEEVGFVGAIGHLEQGWLQAARRAVVCVSLEASRTLPNAEIGKGPVVRLGDRRTIFDADATQVLSLLAEKVLPQRHQRRVMDGGSCEATAATAYGLTTIGLSIPLGNYHNQGLEGGSECPNPLGPAPEFAHLGDIAGQLLLCQALLRGGLPWADPWASLRTHLRRNFRTYRRLI